jgi:hypothetical protein
LTWPQVGEFEVAIGGYCTKSSDTEDCRTKGCRQRSIFVSNDVFVFICYPTDIARTRQNRKMQKATSLFCSALRRIYSMKSPETRYQTAAENIEPKKSASFKPSKGNQAKFLGKVLF